MKYRLPQYAIEAAIDAHMSQFRMDEALSAALEAMEEMGDLEKPYTMKNTRSGVYLRLRTGK